MVHKRVRVVRVALAGFILSLMALTMNGQSPTIDSLKQMLQRVSGQDRHNLLIRLAKDYIHKDPDSALAYAEKALFIGQKYDHEPSKAEAYKYMAAAKESLGNYQKALDDYELALSLYEISNDQSGIGDVYYGVGIVHDLQGSYKDAQKFYTESLRLREKIGDTKGIADCYNGLGIINDVQGKYAEALDYYLKSLTIREEVDDKNGMANSYGNIGIVHFEQGDYGKALEFYNRSWSLYKELGNKRGIADVQSNIGEIHYRQKRLDSALKFFFSSLEIQQELNNKYGMALSNEDISAAYKDQGRYDQALEYGFNSLQLYESLQDKLGVAYANQTISGIYLKKSNFAKSAMHLSKSLSLGKEINASEVILYCYKALSETYENSGDHERSLAHFKSYQALNDSLFNEQKSLQLTELQTKYETEKKEQRIATQQKEIGLLELKKASDRKLRLTLILLAAALLLLASFIYSRYHLKRKSEVLLRDKNEDITRKNKEIEIMNQELERKALRAQMDPHFIFNSMNSIQHFITTNDKTSALKYLSKFSKLIRQILENSINHQVPIADEIKLLEHYIQLEALRFDQQFEHKIEIDENLDIYDIEIPFLLIQPYVENAIVHGLNHKDEKGHLRVRLQDQDEHILCIVEDDGVGRKKAAVLKKGRKHISRGMNVTTRRLELLNKDKKNKTLVEVTDLYDQYDHVAGTKVEIKIPVDLN